MTVFAQDAFNRANGPLGVADFGGAWDTSATPDQWGINTNRAMVASVSSGLGVAKIGVPEADISLSADYDRLEPGRGYMGLFARYVDNNNYYVCHAYNFSIPHHANLWKVVGGVLSPPLANFDVEPPYRLGFQIAGTTLRLLVNGTVEASITDASFGAAGAYGMMFWTTSGGSDSYLDNFLAESFSLSAGSGFRRYRF